MWHNARHVVARSIVGGVCPSAPAAHAEHSMFKNLNASALGVSGTQNEIIELALSHGFKGLDLDLVDFQEQVQIRGLPQARRLLDSAKLKLGSSPLPIDLGSADDVFTKDLERLRTLAELAQTMSCTRTTVVLDPASDERPYHQNFEFHRKRLAEVGATLENYGVSLGVGFDAFAARRADRAYEFIHNPDALLTLLGMVGRSNVGVTVDLFHWHLAGAGTDVLRRLSGEQVVAVRVADAPTDITADSATDEARLLPGETGTINSGEALAVLSELGYEGPATPWPHAGRFRGQRRDDIVKQAGAALESAWRDAGLSTAPQPLIPLLKK
jgi:sugar phosphate isomerase/epimerase